MPRLSMWNPQKTNDYRFFDRTIREQFHVGGVGALIHKYIGPEDGQITDDPSQPDYQNQGLINETSIQDLLFLENRDRKYSKDIYELRGVYNVSDNDFDLTQFGLFLTNDTLYMTFHLNEMVEILGRKLMNGDVIELPHLLEEYALDADTPPIPKFYTVSDGNRGGEGFSATWWSHIWRVKLEPITDSQEFDDILGGADDADSMKNIFSTFMKETQITDAVVESAAQNDPLGGGVFLTDHLYNYINNMILTSDIEWFFKDITENITNVTFDGSVVQYMNQDVVIKTTSISVGDSFPSSPNIGDFYIRNDFNPRTLYVYRDNKWLRLGVENDNSTWENRTFNASTFINNQREDVADLKKYDSRQSITDAILPRDDFDGNTGL